MKPLTIITNNGLIAAREFADFALPTGSLDIRCTVAAVYALPEGAEFIVERYGVGTVRSEVCAVAAALVWVGYFVHLDKTKLPTRKNYHESDST